MKIKISIYSLLAALSLSACSLDEEPYGFYAEENFYNTAADVNSALNYAYGTLTYLEYSRAVFFLGDMPSEELTTKSDATASNQDLNNWKVANFGTNVTLENFYKYGFIGVNRANAVIKNAPKVEMDQALKNQYLGEAYFLRAWNYFNLVRNFGRIPLHTTTVETLSQTSQALADNLDQVYDLILGDCRTAAELMANGTKRRLGRVDRVAAEALAAKAYLYVASAKEHGVMEYREMKRNVEEMYDSARVYADKVVNGQTLYGFDPDLLSIYDVENPTGPEHIFMMSMDRTGVTEGQYSKISKMFIPYISGSTIYLRQGDSSDFIPSHDGFGEYCTTNTFYNMFAANDLRRTHLIVSKVYDAQGNVIKEYPGGGLPYPFSRKYIDPQYSGDKTSTRPFLIRFSDVALIYAEAAGPTARAYELVNTIRQRAGLAPLEEGLSKEQFRQAVLAERTFELAFEGDHMYDIRRWNLVAEMPETRGMSEESVTFYPIPQAEINLNTEIKE